MLERLDRSSSSWSSSNSLPDYIASLYYRYGIFVASNPIKVIVFAISSFFIISIPLWYLPFPGYLPQDYVTSIKNYSVPPLAPEGGIKLHPSSTSAPLWYQGSPVTYIQQVIVRSTITPWQRGITVGESVRAPLFSVFHLSQIINDFQLTKGKSDVHISLGSECLLVEGVVQGNKNSGPSLPNFNCLILSPADLWRRDPQQFMADQNVLLTVKSLKGNHEEETSIADILFGLPSHDIGISSLPNDPQVINYAITIALKQYSEKFIFGLKEELTKKFPLFQPINPPMQFIMHIYFPSQISLWEILIIIFYCFLFSSIYFSFLKMQGLYSKCGLAICIMATLIASLCIATSISAHVGLRPLHSRGKYFYPVLAALIGFENSMVLVRAILSIPDHLDVKIRVAQGLAREGWTITKYFFTMITFVTISFFLFIPLVQEICIYGSLVLLCDLYLQLLFVTAVMAVDLQRGQATENYKMKGDKASNPLFRYPVVSSESNIQLVPQKDVYKACVPNLHRRHTLRVGKGEDILAPPQAKPKPPESIPKRLRLTYFVARKRMFQRMFMCTFIGWIAWMVYTSELVRLFTDSMGGNYNRDLAAVIFSLTNRSNGINFSTDTSSIKNEYVLSPLLLNYSIADTFSNFGNLDINKSLSKPLGIEEDNINITRHLKHTRRSFVRRLPISHWPVLFRYYNISLIGQYISILPPILLSLPINPEYAKRTYNPRDPNSVEWIPKYIESSSASNFEVWKEELAIVPTSNLELFITSVLVIPALAVLVYVTIVLYRCICSRNYAEWRSSSWSQDSFHAEASQIIGEAVPLILAEHPHDIECLCTDGSIIISSCLAGIVCAWDPFTGECIASINRKSNNFHNCQDNCVIDGKSSPFASLPSSQSVPLLLDVPSSSTSANFEYDIFKPISISPSQPVEFKNQDDIIEDLMLSKRKDSLHENSAWNISKNLHEKGLNSSYSSIYATSLNMKCRHTRNLSAGNLPQNMLPIFCRYNGRIFVPQGSYVGSQCSPIWCMECQDGFVYIGTGSGILEMWDVYSSALKCFYDDQTGIGVTLLKVLGHRVIAARLNGSVDILKTELISSPEDANCKTVGQDRYSFSSGDDPDNSIYNEEEKFNFIRLNIIKAHQQPITVLTCDNTRIITGSQDHTLKVLNMNDGCIIFTLHGHYGPITAVTLSGALGRNDPSSVGIAVDFCGIGSVIASGAQDGSLCVWDLITGTCVYSVQAHDGSIVALTCSSSYILSLGIDDKLCVWERFQGHLLNTLIMNHMYCSCMVMLTNRLLITSQQGSLTVWDIAAGTPIRLVKLGDKDHTVFIKYLIPVAGSIVCDYGNQLRVVRLPVNEKFD